VSETMQALPTLFALLDVDDKQQDAGFEHVATKWILRKTLL
jgi:hypothetical protein